MKVLIASDAYYPMVAGSSYFVQRFADTLAGAGHEVAVVAAGQGLRAAQSYRGRVRVFWTPGVPIFFVPGFYLSLPFLINPSISRAIEEFKPDVVHIQMHFFIARRTLKVALRRGIPVVATNHFMPDNLTHYLFLPAGVTRFIDKLMWWDAARIFRKAHGLSAPTRTAVSLMQPQLNQEMLAISNGIDLKRFNPQNDPAPARTKYNLPQKPLLLYVGRLDKEKQVDSVLRAFARARAACDFHFVAAGQGVEKNKLEKLAAKLGISEHVTFTGFVPDELLPSLYAAVDAFVIAGIAELQCIVAMEAMATGLPIIGARAVALPELVHDGENGYLFEPGDEQELSHKMAHLMSDGVLRKKMGQRSLEIIAGHDINTTLEQFEELYRAALRDSPVSLKEKPALTAV
ncbi:MAG: glycosyltransferase [Patescibacteria group bacterium]